MSHSKTTFIGRLTKDPEVKQIARNGKQSSVANFTVAVDENYGDAVDYYNVVAWDKLAEIVEKHTFKGQQVFVEGRLKTRSYPRDVNGTTITMYVSEIRADQIDFLSRPSKSTQSSQPAQSQYDTTNDIADEDLPF
ncbi:single-stranded DNA-binding protein [Bacillus phage vB_BauM_KLEB27-3]|nr:single-stranded DNA-binding protein [Bacillus phage vB_BauM_KLEB27-3]